MSGHEQLADGWLLLRSQDRFARGAAIDPLTGAFRVLTAKIDDSAAISGWFVQRQRLPMALYSHKKRLWFQHGCTAHDLQGLQAQRHVLGPIHRLRLLRADTTVATCHYLDSELVHRWLIPFALIDTAFIEREHYNWSMFVANVVNEPERSARMIEALDQTPGSTPS